MTSPLRLIPLLAAPAALLAASCATSPDDTAWSLAKKVNTPRAYEDYLRRYPNGGHRGEAKTQVSKTKLQKAETSGSVSALADYAKSSDTGEAKRAADKAAGLAVQTSDPAQARAFLVQFKGHKSAASVRARLETLEADRALAAREAEPAFLFLRKYPKSARAAEVAAVLASLEKAPSGGAPLSGEQLRAAWDSSPLVRRRGCALILGRKIASASDEAADDLRAQLEALPASGGLPDACPGPDGLAGAGPGLVEKLEQLSRQREDLASKEQLFRQRDEMVGTSLAAAAQLGKDLESDELAGEVLGTSSLGSLDTGLSEKGSATAKKAEDRLSHLRKRAAKNAEVVKELLRELDRRYDTLQLAVAGSLKAS